MSCSSILPLAFLLSRCISLFLLLSMASMHSASASGAKPDRYECVVEHNWHNQFSDTPHTVFEAKAKPDRYGYQQHSKYVCRYARWFLFACGWTHARSPTPNHTHPHRPTNPPTHTDPLHAIPFPFLIPSPVPRFAPPAPPRHAPPPPVPSSPLLPLPFPSLPHRLSLPAPLRLLNLRHDVE